MATRNADNVQMDASAEEEALNVPSEPLHGNHQSGVSPRAPEAMETADRGGRRNEIQDGRETKKTPTSRKQAQRVRTVRLTTQIHPDTLVPYLYGERGGRSINSIASVVGCTIDYCALSPDESERSPQTHAYVMNFLVSAATSEKLEEATRQLKKLVERVQVHLQKKARVPGGAQRSGYDIGRARGELDELMDLGVDDRHYFEAMGRPMVLDPEASAGRNHLSVKRRVILSPTATASTDPAGVDVVAVSSKKDSIHDGEKRWTTNNAAIDAQPEEAWDLPVAPMRYYADYRPQRPRYIDVAGVEDTEKNDFAMSGNEASYLQQQKNEPTAQFVTRRRVRRYPDHSRWPLRHYERSPTHFRNGMRYVVYAGASPDGGNDHGKRILGPRQQRYQGAVDHFSQEYDPYSYEEEDDDGSGVFAAYEKEVDLANETAGAADSTGFVDAPDHRQSVRHHNHAQPSRRSLKRPLSTMRGDVPHPPPIYRQRMPYIYEYAYDEDDDEWMTDDEEIGVAYSYPTQYHHMEVPVVHRRRRFDSVGSVHQWESPAGHGHRRMMKRRRIPHDGLPLEPELNDNSVYEATNRDHVISPRKTHPEAPHSDQIDGEVNNLSVHIFPQRANSAAETAQVGLEGESAITSSDDNQIDTAVVEAGEKPVVPVMRNVAEGSSNVTLTASMISVGKQNDMLIETSTEQALVAHIQEHPAADEANQAPGGETSIIDEMEMYGSVVQSGIISLDPNALAQETSVEQSQRASTSKSDHSPWRRKTSEENKEDDCTASFPVAAENNYACNNVNNIADTYLADSTEKSEYVPTASSVEAASIEDKVRVPSVDAEACALDKFAEAKVKSLSSTDAFPSQVNSIVTDAIRINNHVIASLERMNRMEAAYVTAKASLMTQEDKFRGLEDSSKFRDRLKVLCGVVHDLQSRIGSQLCGLNHSRKQDLLGKLDGYLENTLTSEQTLQEKVVTLQVGLERILCTNELIADSQVCTNDAMKTQPSNAMRDNVSASPCPVLGSEHDDENVHNMNWEDDGWFDESSSTDPVTELEDQEDFVAQVSPRESNLKLEGEYLLVKLEEGDSPRWPHELPSFVWSLLARVISSDPQSYVMRVTHKRLMEEIARGDPYYYLHPIATRKDDVNSVVSSPLRSSPPQACEFGCRGASALKWERKLVSQISSRMKSFDNVAYSLARSSGGKEVLNRKKMNSIIRKLHLVAMQLHSLISHLYCVKGHTTCKEVDSLPIALNNSHFERKMGIYKSRLKLVMPHKCQNQQQQQQQSGPMEPAEELLRDTYEFFPELLLCVDIWGYDYRESQARRHASKNLHNDGVSSGIFSERELFPLGFFRGVESHAFDFEHDGNGLLRRICDELLNIVCLWNDFKWTDNLEGIALERVVVFETDVTASIIKILDLHANHLQALWAVRLLDDPERLRNVHFTQLNTYYSDRSQGSLTVRAIRQSHESGLSESSVSKSVDSGLNYDVSAVNQLMANEIIEQRLAEEYWKHKVAVLSAHDPIDDAIETDDIDVKAAQFLSVETIASWDQPTQLSYLFRWSDVYAMRTDMSALSSVTNHMLKHEMQKYQIAGRPTNKNGRAGTPVSGIVDATSKQILAAVSRAQMLIRDVIVPSEKLALHSASNQLPDDIQHLTGVEALAAANTTDMLNGQESGVGCDRVLPSDEVEALNDENGSEIEGLDKADMESTPVPEQPELQDLIQLLVVTKREMQELCSHRPRSARMREKLQTQSVQLAKQTVEIFRNIRNMYGSQRR